MDGKKWWRENNLDDPPVGYNWVLKQPGHTHRHGDCDKDCFVLETTDKKEEEEGGQNETKD